MTGEAVDDVSPGEDKPFFAIDEASLAEAIAPVTTPQAAPEPQVIFGQPMNPTSTPSTPQLTGVVPVQQPQFMLTHAPPKPTKTVRWLDYFAGVVVPLLIIALMFIGEETVFAWESPYLDKELTVESEDGTTYSVHFPQYEDETFLSFTSEFTSEGHTIVLRCPVEGNGAEVAVEQRNRSSTVDANIGTYHLANSTAFFQLDQANADELVVEMMYYDDTYTDEDPLDYACCLFPFVYLGSILAAFVSGRKALGFGLISSFVVGLVAVPVMSMFIGALF